MKQFDNIVKQLLSEDGMISDSEYLDEYTKDRSAFDVSEPEGVPGSNGEYTRRVIISSDDKVLADLTCMFSLDDSLMSCKPSDNSDGEYDDIYADKIARIIRQHRYRSSGEDNEDSIESAELEESMLFSEGAISNVVKSVAAKFDDAAVKKLIRAVNGSTAIQVIVELRKLSPKKRANLHRAITSWIERNSNNAAVKQLTRLQTSLKESVDLEESYTSNYMTDQRRSDK